MMKIGAMSAHTLSLFGLQACIQEKVSGAHMSDAAAPAPARNGDLGDSSDQRVIRGAEAKAIYDEMKAESQEDIMRGYAMHAERQAFLRENGYRNELTNATYHAVNVANSYIAGEKQFENREEAIGEAASRIGQLLSRVQNVNDLRDYNFVATEAEPDKWKRVIYDFVEKSDAAAVSSMSPEMKALADKKMAHDLIATDLNLQIDQGMLLKDFGVSRGVVSRGDDGSASVGAFTITHSKFGDIAEYRDGEVYVFTEGHGRERFADYEQRRASNAP